MDTNVTLFRSVTNPDDLKQPAVVPVLSVLKGIRAGKWKDPVLKIRDLYKKEERDRIKKMLPAACFAGVFNYRSIQGFKSSSGLVPIDFDGLDSVQMDLVGGMIKELPFVYAAFVSPSGRGWKALVRAEFSSYEEYKSVFYAIDNTIGQLKSFDLSNSDISRACFMSYDPDAYINEHAELFTERIDNYEEYSKRRRLASPDKIFIYLQKWMSNSGYEYQKGARNEYLYILASAMCRYGVEDFETEGLFITKFSDISSSEIKLVISSAYKRNEFGIVRLTDLDPSDDMGTYKGLEIPDFSFDPSMVIDDTVDTNMGVYKIASGEQQFDSFGLKAMDKYLVLKRNELYAFVAGSKTGKTLAVLFMAAMAAKHSGWKFLMLVTENELSEYKSTLVGFLNNKPIRRCNKDEIEESLLFIDEHFTFIHNELDHLQVFDTYHYLKTQGKDYDAIVIDPITNVKKSKKIAGTGNEYFDALYVEYLAFCRKYVSVWVIAHTITSKERERTPPYVQDAEYGVYLARRCHYGITFFRDSQDEIDSNKVECHVRYNRTQLTKGGDVTLNNNPINMYFVVKPDFFGYDIEVDYRKYPNPLIYQGAAVALKGIESPDKRIEKQTTYYDTLYEGERDPEF